MSTSSKIEWTETTWNPVTGCTKISEGCRNCYAERLAGRLKLMGLDHYTNGFQLTTHEDALEQPFKWKRPQVIFVNSMSDLFHKDVPKDFIQRVFTVMAECPQHTFQVLTKRSERLRELAPTLQWPSNVWMGVSVENSDTIQRIIDLQQVPAAIRFISFEPLIGPINTFPVTGIGWAIVGGESGPHARSLNPDWVEPIFETCQDYCIPFFFKQWGGTNKKKTGRLLHGRVYNERPELHSIQIQDLVYT
jgi:protein gp37